MWNDVKSVPLWTSAKSCQVGSETIHTLDVELAEDNFVTSVALLECSDGAQLYVGTSKGLLVVANALLLQPLSACRPYSGELTSICVVEGPRDDDGSFKIRGTLSTTSSESGLGWVRERVSETLERIRGSPAPLSGQGTAVVVTIGRAYRNLSSHEAQIENILKWASNDDGYIFDERQR
ncbi:hypothetical protein TELCIR_03901 [Teladorsagia circumcincta]|uniref:Uncharacterized protein n=1 Tax=Teladorsagia circumcincta TaxID=45464 RepID=A0A2G9UX61_TELCI|nr:hypothetical protein TELCIR_03901 [Teladorsagia circumcincta]